MKISRILAVLALSVGVITACKHSTNTALFDNFEWTEVVATDFSAVDRWEPRAGLQAVEFNSQLYVIAGRTPLPPTPPDFNPFASQIHGDVWVSSDVGSTWYELLADAESEGLWKNRAYFEAVTTKDYIYILGGQNFTTVLPPTAPDFQTVVLPSEFFKDVWRSSDGVNWEQMTSDAEWATLSENCAQPGATTQGRAGLSAVYFKGKIWVMGGSQGDDNSIGGGENCRQFYNDVWYSEDGVEWILATGDAPWEARAGGVALVKNGWIYYMGGEKGFVAETDYFNDVWRSRDGANWQQVTGPSGAGWSPRPGHKCSVVGNNFVCMGGFGTPTNPSDIWVSGDGANWEQISDSPWSNDPTSSIFFCDPNKPDELVCDNIRYDFDMLTYSYGNFGQQQAILTFGGDREVFFFVEGELNHLRVENDVWRYGPPD